jgi:apolipoprotein N-acyltransferase
MSRRTLPLCLLLSALLWWLSMQRAGLFPLGWIALAPLLWAVTPLAPRERWRWSYAGGFVALALHNWWLVPTIARGAPAIGFPVAVGAILGVVGVALIALIHGFGFALVCLAWGPSRWERAGRIWVAPLLFGALWWAFENLRGVQPLCHLWGALAFSQWRDTALLQTASLVGQHGLSALCAWTAACLALWLRRGEPSLLWPPVLVLFALHVWGAVRLQMNPLGQGGTRVLLVQTNVPSLRKSETIQDLTRTPFYAAYRETDDFFNANTSAKFALVLWPETSIAVTKESADAPAIVQPPEGVEASVTRRLARDKGVTLVTGAQVKTLNGEAFNQAIAFAPGGGQSVSSKVRLVPFGERAPFGERLPFLTRFAPNPQVVAGSEQTNRSGPPVLLCFESCFPSPAREIALRAPYLLVLTNDEWFAGTSAPFEHAMMAVVRAAETGRPLAQVANGGHSFVVDRFGRCALNSANFASRFGGFSEFGEARAIPVVLPR